MANIRIRIYQPPTDKTTDVQLPDDVPVRRLLPVLAERLGIEAQSGGVTDYKLAYKGPNPPDPYPFTDDDTLAGKQVKEGSLLTFTHTFTAG